MKYRVTFEVYASTSVTVEAESEEAAKEKACKRVHATVCHQCSREVSIDDIGEITDVEPAEDDCNG